MNICNGVSLSSVPLIEYKYKSDIYYDNLCMLDIEVVTAFWDGKKLIPFDKSKSAGYYDNMSPFSLMYLWNMCIDGYLFSGRSLEDLQDFLINFDLLLHGRFYIYVHNLGYEFQFLRNILDDMEVFARKKRKPIKFLWRNLEFRCSYMLTRLSLEVWAKEKNLPVKKLKEYYDYNKIRTPLTHLEIIDRDYGYNDVLIGVAGLKEYKERYKHVKNIPLTQTSCIRKTVNNVMKDEYKARMRVSEMTRISFNDYRFLVDCFTGGYTHANIILSDKVIDNVWDFDISSSYPWAMISEKYPTTCFIKSTNRSWYYMKHADRYAYMMEVEFINVNSLYFNTYISASKCLELEGAVLDNGRVISANKIVMRILDIDYIIIKKAYDIESERIIEFYYALKDYLPVSFCRYLVQLFCHKTELKNIDEKFNLYFKSKEELNGNYGMGVTRDITDEITYIKNEWGKSLLTAEKYYEKANKKADKIYNLNLSYSQGIYVPAYGRKNLWYMVFELDDLIAYMDTDSIKIIPPHDGVLEVINQYNDMVHKKQKEIANRLGITYDSLNPHDVKGIKHSIGVYERDEDIKKFKTLGAKRYICQYDESKGLDYLKMTVSGVRKKAVEQLCSINDFTESLVFQIGYADKLLLLYNDNQEEIVWNKGEYDEWRATYQYGISAYNIEYSMKMNPHYFSLINDVKNDETEIFKRKVIT